MKFLLQILSLFFLLFTTACTSESNSLKSTDVSILAISDVHFTPFYDASLFPNLVHSPVEEWTKIFESSSLTKPSVWGEETNYALLKLTLNALFKQTNNSKLIIFPGDILCHNFSKKFYALYGEEDTVALNSFIYKTIFFFTTQIRQHSKEIPIIFTLGNNDSYSGDYKLKPNSAFLIDTADLFYNSFLLESTDKNRYLSTYTSGGYYSVTTNDEKILFISMNSVFFSKHSEYECLDSDDNIATQELEWLEESLKTAEVNNQKVYILTHIPIGIDVYSSVYTYMNKEGKISGAKIDWKDSCQSKFLDISREYISSIETIFSGHTHMDQYQLIFSTKSNEVVADITIPAISPEFGNNPSFKVFTFDEENWKLLDYKSLVYDINNSQADFNTYYTFSKKYKKYASLSEGLISLYPQLKTNVKDKESYTHLYYSGHDESNPINKISWPAYWCGVGVVSKEAFVECVNSY